MLKEIASGTRFGKWTVIERTCYRKESWRYSCRCDCGTVREVDGGTLRNGTSTSCGCKRKEKPLKHGHTKGGQSPEYVTWHNMLQRCEKTNHPSYPNYGGRGISVCPDWQDFRTFLRDMGPRPSAKHSLERIDNDGPYSPENCRWALWREQCNNKRDCVPITFRGETLNLAQWAERLGFNKGTLEGRLRRGWSVERAFTEPLDLSMKRR